MSAEAITLGVLGTVGPTLAGLAAWKAARSARQNTETGNGQVLGAYVVSVDRKVDDALSRIDRVERKVDRNHMASLAHDERDRQAFREAGLTYPDVPATEETT